MFLPFHQVLHIMDLVQHAVLHHSKEYVFPLLRNAQQVSSQLSCYFPFHIFYCNCCTIQLAARHAKTCL